jgi:hypothetical protein
MLYQGYALLQLLFQLIAGTGRKPEPVAQPAHEYGAPHYKHYVYKELAQLTSFLMERSRLPCCRKR